MLKKHLAAGIAATALMTVAATAQTTAPTQPAGQGQIMTQMPKDLMRGSKLMGVDVYGADNQKIGDVDEVLVDRQGKIHGIVVGVGGFLGIGKKDVAIPYEQVQWMSSREVQASSAANQGTNTAGGVTTPNAPATNGPAATGSTGATGTTGTAGSGAGTSAASDDTAPARAMVKMTKADLQNAPEFQYSDEANRSSTTGGTGNTNPPPASANRPGNAPQQ
jgi:sporulation protein YlmC with PRC-barrel domain